MNEHTKNWVIQLGNTNYCYFIGDDPNISNEEAQANLELIQKAPRLLALNKELVEALEVLYGNAIGDQREKAWEKGLELLRRAKEGK